MRKCPGLQIPALCPALLPFPLTPHLEDSWDRKVVRAMAWKRDCLCFWVLATCHVFLGKLIDVSLPQFPQP